MDIILLGEPLGAQLCCFTETGIGEWYKGTYFHWKVHSVQIYTHYFLQIM